MNKISSQGIKSIYKFHEEKKQHATSFKNRKLALNMLHEQDNFHDEINQHETSFARKTQQETSSVNKNRHKTSSMNKISTQEVR